MIYKNTFVDLYIFMLNIRQSLGFVWKATAYECFQFDAIIFKYSIRNSQYVRARIIVRGDK